jgi:uncharacterized protein (DUF362 family)
MAVRTRESLLEQLVTQADPDGGWGYTGGKSSHPEPTCLALLALKLAGDKHAQALAAGRRALARHAFPDNSYRLLGGREEAVWPTALVLFTFLQLSEEPGLIAAIAGRLLSFEGRIPDDPRAAEQIDIDYQLRGWPWAENTFSWAEPTAWACLALRRAGCSDHERVAMGLKLLLDRSADEGGINYGNRRVFGRMTEPLVEPTAIMLLALQGLPDNPRIGAAVEYLRAQGLESEDLEQLSWTRLALEVHRQRPGIDQVLPKLDERIHAAYELRQKDQWLAAKPLREALPALALASDQCNMFRLPTAIPAPIVRPATNLSRARPLGERIKGAFRGILLEGAARLRPLAPSSMVHIAPAADYNVDLAGILQTQYAAFRDKVSLEGKRVVLKPNLVEYHRDKVINTNPHVVAATIELCRREKAELVIVAEGPGHCRNVEYLVKASGLGDVLAHYKVPFVDLNHDEPVKTLNLGRLTGLDYLYLARTIASADVVISLPKLKTHHWAGATLSLKNLFGTLPGICYGWPKNELHWRGIDNSIVDIALSRPPNLAIVDGIVGMEGDGPLNGTPRKLGALIMASDPVAADATCCRLMGLDPERIGYLHLANRKKLGHLASQSIEQIGENVAAIAQTFETLPHFNSLRMTQSA